jgi:hypothetical protein
MTHRVMPPSSGFYNPITVNGATYSCAANGTLDVPDHVADVMVANGWVRCGDTGANTTANRPANPRVGQTFLDTTLGYVIKWDGKAWRNPVTGVAV